MGEQIRYTVLDYKVTAENCEKLSKSFLCGDGHDRANYADMAAMLRQAADSEEENANRKHAYAELMKVNAATNKENAQLKARLEAVVKLATDETWRDDKDQGVSVNTCAKIHNSVLNDILRAARGEGGAE